MKRLAAVVVAVGLVVGAVLIRGRIDDAGDGGGGGGGDTLRLVCGTDLAAACELLAEQDDSIEVTVQDEGTTADRLSLAETEEAGFDAWLTAGPWPAVVADNRGQAGAEPAVLGKASDVLARSPATIVALDDRAAALAASCGAAVTWACIGGVAGLPWTQAGGQAAWGAVKPGLQPPGSGAGLVALSQAVSSEVGTTSYASNDFEDPAVSAWFDQLVGQAKRNRSPGQTPLQRFLVLPASYGAVGSLEAESGPSVAKAANRSDLQVIYPEPVATADVALAPAAGTEVADVVDRIGAERLSDALAATGWRVSGRDTAPGVGGGPALPDGAGLPGPGVLQFLRDRWEQVP